MRQRSKILGVITARGGSKGIPRKNVKLLGGKPLIAWTIETALNTPSITECIVSTDDEEIAAVAREYGAKVPFMRPEGLADNDTPHLPVMQHGLLEMEKINGTTYDIAIILQPTSPFRKPAYIDKVIAALTTSDEADSAVSVYEVGKNYHPMKMKRIEKGFLVPFCACAAEPQGTRRQEMESVYKRSGDVYAIKRSCLIEKKSLFGDKILPVIIPSHWAIDIDEPKDWELAEALAETWKHTEK